LNLNYKPIYLDEEFEKKYEEYALKTLQYSDGTAPILRANFPYAFEELCKFSKVNITGLFGSEIIKPFYKANEQINQETIDLFMSSDFDKRFDDIIAVIKRAGYLKAGIFDRYAQEIKEDFKKDYIQKLDSYNKIARFYIFFLEESVRKYFMQEIRIERCYVDTRTPYFDEDFLELIFKTPFAGIYKGALKKNPFQRRKSQIFYTKMIKKTKPMLGDIITDRGYKPSDFLSPSLVTALKVGMLYTAQKMRKYMRPNGTFRGPLWSSDMVKKYVNIIGKEDDIFTDKLIKDFESGMHLRSNFRFFSIFSLRLWFYLNCQNKLS
jgi:hypothetical protein